MAWQQNTARSGKGDVTSTVTSMSFAAYDERSLTTRNKRAVHNFSGSPPPVGPPGGPTTPQPPVSRPRRLVAHPVAPPCRASPRQHCVGLRSSRAHARPLSFFGASTLLPPRWLVNARPGWPPIGVWWLYAVCWAMTLITATSSRLDIRSPADPVQKPFGRAFRRPSIPIQGPIRSPSKSRSDGQSSGRDDVHA